MLIFVLAVIVVALIVVGIRRRRRRRQRHRRDASLPPLLFEVRDEGQQAVRPPPLAARRTPPTPEPPPAPQPSVSVTRTAAPVTAPPAPTAPTTPAAAAEPPRGYLPGRLEIVRGRHSGTSVRVPRGPGDAATVTLGRGDGPRDSHIQLDEETVSRRHARMHFERGRWSIVNLSQTNPIVVNGHVLGAGAAALLLDDGDTIEMGDLVLRFRAT